MRSLLKSICVAVAIAALFLVILTTIGRTHEVAGPGSWIGSGGYRGPLNSEWCCGGVDCAELDDGTARAVANGYSIHGWGTIHGTTPEASLRLWFDEAVPSAEVLASQDGRYWRCQRPDSSRRCFFAPPPSW